MAGRIAGRLTQMMKSGRLGGRHPSRLAGKITGRMEVRQAGKAGRLPRIQ